MKLRGVGVRREGRAILEGVDLDIRDGERVAVVGPSGAGKTTLLRVLAGRLTPDTGERSGPYAGWIPQDAGLVPNTAVLTNVLLGELPKGVWGTLFPGSERRARAIEALDQVGLGGRADDSVDVLSGGERQRVALARVLFARATVVIADEPVSALDPALTESALAQLLELSAGHTLVMSLHDPELVRRHFPRVIELKDGRVVRDERR